MKKKIIIVMVVAFAMLLVGASSLYGVLAYTAMPGGMSNINNEQAMEEPSDDSAATAEEATDDSAFHGGEMEAPDFTVFDAEGNEVSLADMAGKPTLINFWTSWCTYCKQEMPDFQRLYQDYGDRVNFMLIDATTDAGETLEKAKAYIAENGYDMPFYFDENGEALGSYIVRGYPTTYLVDASGNLVAYASGMTDYESMAQAFDKML